MSRIRKLIITIDCRPKAGRAEALFNSTKKHPQSIQTSYIYEQD